MRKYTRGDWWYDEEYYVIKAGVGIYICEISSPHHHESIHNAILISQAPKLLEALKTLYAEEHRDDDDPILIQARILARDAIKAAEGE